MILETCPFPLYFSHRHGFQMNDWLAYSLLRQLLTDWLCRTRLSCHLTISYLFILSYHILHLAEFLSEDHILEPVWGGAEPLALWLLISQGSGIPEDLIEHDDPRQVYYFLATVILQMHLWLGQMYNILVGTICIWAIVVRCQESLVTLWSRMIPSNGQDFLSTVILQMHWQVSLTEANVF